MWKDYLDDFQELAEVLDVLDATAATSNSLRLISGFAQASWHANNRISSGEAGIEIPPPRNKAMHPALCKAESAMICFVFELGDFEANSIPRQADFQVKVAGILEGENCYVELEDHWRVDSHLFPLEEAREPHPYFHFQRGGHAQDRFAGNDWYVPSTKMPEVRGALWRGLMQSPGPRIPVAPHCPILAIDFAIGQHDGTVWHHLRADPDYSAIIRRAQARLWQPFFEALARPAFRSRWMGPVFA
ncbi:hypothetical protein NX774_17765 [Massilia agilis]|uniref:TIGR04255 family protein n=1 Tax=Massilia agilis TaxID=1811226 RepID=A0ABT2DEM2_9BURK|nr:hypothetical protein [Massilia agilis]MCS0809773.1 hypothetical protein [Massilia agilis]